MKQIIIIILLTFCVSNVFSQQYTPMTAAGYQMKRLKVDSTLHIPSFCGVPTTRNSTAKEGAIAIDTCNNLLYTWTNGDGWTSLSGGIIVDTAAINAAILLRVKYTDTLLMLQPYLRKIDTTNKWVNSVTKINDSTIRVIKNTLTTDLLIRGNGVKYSDTATMLLPYLRKVDTTAMLSKYLRKTDTASLSNRINLKVNISDTATMLSKYLRKTDTTNRFVNNVTKINDSTIRIFKGATSSDLLIRGNASGSGSGTVTSVATGYGLSGGPITTTGTLLVDSATLSGKYLRINDTTAMLLPYLRKIDTTAMLLPYLRKVDTTAMLLPYLRNIDTTNRFVNSVTSINDSTIRVFKGSTSSNITIKGSTTGYVPYVGATTDVDLDTHILNAQSIGIKGTNGAGHIDLRHQASDASATGQTTALFADINGDLKYKNAGNFYTTLKTSGNAANAIYTYPSATTTLIGAADTSVFLRKTDSATYYTIYRSDTSRTNIYSAINGKQASGSYITISDTSVFQRKNISAYSLQANNTNAAANVTTQTFRDVAEAAISGTIAWVGTTAPSSLTSANYSWSQIGKTVTVEVNLLYVNASSAITAFSFPLPSDMPIPVTPTGWSAASNYLFTSICTVHATAPAITSISFYSFIRRDAANTGYELGATGSAATARGWKFTLTYKAQ